MVMVGPPCNAVRDMAAHSPLRRKELSLIGPVTKAGEDSTLVVDAAFPNDNLDRTFVQVQALTPKYSVGFQGDHDVKIFPYHQTMA